METSDDLDDEEKVKHLLKFMLVEKARYYFKMLEIKAESIYLSLPSYSKVRESIAHSVMDRIDYMESTIPDLLKLLRDKSQKVPGNFPLLKHCTVMIEP